MRTTWHWLAYSTLISPLLVNGCAMPKNKLKRDSLIAESEYSAKEPGSETSSRVAEAKKYSAANDSPDSLILPASFQTQSVESAGFNQETTSPLVKVETDVVPINLPSALAVVDGTHPVVGLAQWRVREAYAQMERANVMWLPSIQPGFNFRRRDGHYQAVGGEIVDVNLNSINYGLGSGAVAAGSPVVPGVMAQFHLADAIFLPKNAEKTAWARGHAATATLNEQLLHSGLAYCDLLEAFQASQVLQESFGRTEELMKITAEYAKAGEGLQADADRTATEVALLQARMLSAKEQQYVASSRLSRALSVPMTTKFVPQDVVVLPIEFASAASDEGDLVAQGLARRPELKESQALVAAASEAYKREKYAPFVPSVLLGFSTTSFGGGIGSNPENFGGRYDADAMLVWETRNLGFGERAARREKQAQIQQATYTKLRIMDQVAQEIAEAKAQVVIRKQQIEIMEQAIASASSSYTRNLDRIKQGQGLPIEVLQAIQALETAQRSYVKAVVDYNRAQLQLQWALGWQVDQGLIENQVTSATEPS